MKNKIHKTNKIRKKESEECYHVYDGNNHEYTIVVTRTNIKTCYNLYYSNTSAWTNTVAGTKILTIEDNGNSYHLPDIIGVMEPDRFAELVILITFIKNYDKHFAPDYTIKKPEQVIITI